MPKIDSPSKFSPLTVSQLRALRMLAESEGLSRSALERATGGAAALRGLASLGLVVSEEIDVDGLTERVWLATDLGKERLAGAAAPAANGKARRMPGKTSRIDSASSGSGQAVAGPEELPGPAIGALAPWFGAARGTAEAVGEALQGCKWVGIPFCGGLSEVPAILRAGANAVALNDRHRLLINLARVAADPKLGAQLFRRVRRIPFCVDSLREAQARCRLWGWKRAPDLGAAVDYFVCAWMGRSGESGKINELKAGLAIRYGAGGGNSVLRFANACFSLRAWRAILARCSFSCDDGFDFLTRCNDRDDAGVYCDSPWDGPGKNYLHSFQTEDHERLAEALGKFERARIVVRSGGGKLAERLYPRKSWDWKLVAGRAGSNRVFEEWLIQRRGRES